MLATRISDGTSGICDMKMICCPHGRSGTNTTGSETLIIEKQKAHRVGDNGSCNCPHGGTFISTQGSKIVLVDGRALTLIGHQTVCMNCGMSGSHVSGSKIFEVSQ